MGKFSFYWFWSILFTVVILAIVGSFVIYEHSVTEWLNAVLNEVESTLLVALLIVAALAADVLLPIPSSLVSVSAGVALGVGSGFLVIWLGLSLGCVVGYGLGAGCHFWCVKNCLKEQDVQKAQGFGARYGLVALVVLRAVPVLAETSVLAAGITKIPFARFILATGMANAGVAFVYAYLGAYAGGKASILLVLVASIVVPGAAWGLSRCLRREESVAATDSVEIMRPGFSVKFNYPVCFTREVFAPENLTLINQIKIGCGACSGVNKVLFVADRHVIKARPELEERVKRYCGAHQLTLCGGLIELPGGEAAKVQPIIDGLHRQMLQHRLDRQSFVIAIGGGAVLDAVGYAASTFHRGLRLIRLPTTVLAQNDAGIGVKNGINAEGQKNLLGCFSVPHAVINDCRFLTGLSARDFRAGFAEAVKVAAIRDADFFHWLELNADLLNQRNEEAVEYLIKRCAQLHLQQICRGGDPFESGSARPLDYGHWGAHKLEMLSHHQLSHGEAVAIGMTLDALYAVNKGMLKLVDADRLFRLLQQLEFKLWHPCLELQTTEGQWALLAGLEEFRQHLGGGLCIPLLTRIGYATDVSNIDCDALDAARKKLLNCAALSPFNHCLTMSDHEVNKLA